MKQKKKKQQQKAAFAPLPPDPLRDALFTPCATKEELHAWVECYLDIDLPDTIVEERSNSSPMDNLWTIYNVMRLRRFRLFGFEKYIDWSEVMAYSSRDSFKTVSAAILEVVCMLHLSLSVAHAAAIEQQARKAQSYVKDYFRRPYLRDYVIGSNERKIEISRYRHRLSEKNLNEEEFNQLSTQEQMDYDRRYNYLVILVCTLGGMNSEHVPLLVFDEVDVIRGESVRAFEEGKLIPSAWQGCEPITLYTSTRKSSFGLVQQELDNADTSGLKVFHWNIIDVTSRCPPERHLPDEPKIPIYIQEPERQTRGNAIGQETFDLLPDEKKQLYRQEEGYAGCLKNCKLFFACRGQLATKQKPSGPNSLLKSHNATTTLFKKVSPGTANAQLLCGKPSEEGLIYPRLDNQIHKLTASEMAEKIDGEPHPEIQTKAQLLAFMIDRGMDFVSGLDHGHTHNFAVVTGARDEQRLFVIDCLAMPGLELDHKKLHMQVAFKAMGINPRIWPDTASPDSNKSLRKAGFLIQTWKKVADSVAAGIEDVRAMLHPAVGEPTVYFLAEDEGVELLFLRLSKYHWKLDDAGRPSAVPDDTEDDECDAFRYLVMNNFTKGVSFIGAVSDQAGKAPSPIAPLPTTENYLTYFINQAVGAPTDDVNGGDSDDPDNRGRSGGFIFDIS